MSQERFYRSWVKDNRSGFQIKYRQTDLWVAAPAKYRSLCMEKIRALHQKFEDYLQQNSDFKTSLKPLSFDNNAPAEIQKMMSSSEKMGVGPMAAVAGLFAEEVGQILLEETEEVIVENGGDIFLASKNDITVGIYAGSSPFSGKLGLRIKAAETPLGICTSAGTVGPSLSLGTADAVIVISPSTTMADAAATALGNQIKDKNDIQPTLESTAETPEIKGVIIIKDNNIGIRGDIELVQTK